MKILLSILVLIGLTASAYADQYVHGYYRQNGTYVQPYMRSSPDSSTLNNWSTQGNTNPYTGAQGTRNPYNSGNSYGGYGNNSYGSQNTFGSPAPTNIYGQ
jgi:hypothetical protein